MIIFHPKKDVTRDIFFIRKIIFRRGKKYFLCCKNKLFLFTREKILFFSRVKKYLFF